MYFSFLITEFCLAQSHKCCRYDTGETGEWRFKPQYFMSFVEHLQISGLISRRTIYCTCTYTVTIRSETTQSQHERRITYWKCLARRFTAVSHTPRNFRLIAQLCNQPTVPTAIHAQGLGLKAKPLGLNGRSTSVVPLVHSWFVRTIFCGNI